MKRANIKNWFPIVIGKFHYAESLGTARIGCGSLLKINTAGQECSYLAHQVFKKFGCDNVLT